MGIPVPLHCFFSHVAILVRCLVGNGGGVPKNDSGYLHGLANAGLPYMSLVYTDIVGADPPKADPARIRTMCALHERVGLLEMTNHEFLDKSYRKQRTTFADGTTVTIDLDADTFQIAPELLLPNQQ